MGVLAGPRVEDGGLRLKTDVYWMHADPQHGLFLDLWYSYGQVPMQAQCHFPVWKAVWSWLSYTLANASSSASYYPSWHQIDVDDEIIQSMHHSTLGLYAPLCSGALTKCNCYQRLVESNSSHSGTSKYSVWDLMVSKANGTYFDQQWCLICQHCVLRMGLVARSLHQESPPELATMSICRLPSWILTSEPWSQILRNNNIFLQEPPRQARKQLSLV